MKVKNEDKMVELVKEKNNSYENPFLSDDDNGVFKDNR